MKANTSNIQETFNDIPDRYISEETTYDNYKMCEELHFGHGWRNVELPEITEFQKLADLFILTNDIVTKEVIDLTEEEIAEKNKVVVPESVNNIQFITQLAFEGITESQVLAVIDTLTEPNKTVARVSYFRAVRFFRNNPLMQLVGQAFNKTEAQMDDIFINADKL